MHLFVRRLNERRFQVRHSQSIFEKITYKFSNESVAKSSDTVRARTVFDADEEEDSEDDNAALSEAVNADNDD